MAHIRRRLLATLVAAAGVAAYAGRGGGNCLFPDDPIWQVPPPIPVGDVNPSEITQFVDLALHTLADRRSVTAIASPLEGGAINTLGEVPDSSWFQNRHGLRRLSIADLKRGACRGAGPSTEAPWTVLSAKNTGITPGFVIEDAEGRKFILKLDPHSNPEIATAAEIVGSKFFHALGYNVPENYLVRFNESQLALGARSLLSDRSRRVRRLTKDDLNQVLARSPRGADGLYRGVASLYIPGQILGPFEFFGVRPGDPNDIVPHEHRRDLRGLHVFAAWLNRNDFKANNTLDTVVEENGLRYVRHYLIDFGSTLGSGAFQAKIPSAGHEYLFDFKPALRQILTLGLAVPAWQRVKYPGIPSVGNFESKSFDPRAWKPNYPNPAFDLRTAEDTYWAAKKVMAFTNADIRAIVEEGGYTDPTATEYVTRILAERRDKIGRAYLMDVLPLENFRISNHRLVFEDLAVTYGFASPRNYVASWRVGNRSEQAVLRSTQLSLTRPVEASRGASYVPVEFTIPSVPDKSVTVYIRNAPNALAVAAVNRTGGNSDDPRLSAMDMP